MNELQRRVRYRDEEVNGSDYLIGMLLQQYEQGRYSEQDKALELQRNRRLVEQMLAPNAKVPVIKMPEFSKAQEQIFERIEVLMMHKQPLFRVVASTERRQLPIVQEEVIRNRTVLEKLCACCGNFVKKHCCPHSLCHKPCKVEEKRLRMRVNQQSKGTDENNPQEPSDV